VIKDILRNLSKAFQVVFKRAASLTAKIGNMYVPWHALKIENSHRRAEPPSEFCKAEQDGFGTQGIDRLRLLSKLRI